MSALPYWPAAMDLKSAASYCGVCVETFRKVCPVKPVQFTGSTRGERYLRHRLDEWLVSIDPNEQSTRKLRLVDRLHGDQGEARRP